MMSFFLVLGNFSYGVSSLSEEDFEGDDTVIYAKTIEVEYRLYGRVIRQDEWGSKTLGAEGVSVDLDLAEKAWNYQHRARGDSVAALLERAERPSEKELAEAEKEDEAVLKKLKDDVKKMEQRLGLVPKSDDEFVAYYYAGEATMQVIECFHGDLLEGDSIKVTWKDVLRKRTCPHMIPYKGSNGWLLKGKVKANGEAELVMGAIRGREQMRKFAKKAQAKKEKASE